MNLVLDVSAAIAVAAGYSENPLEIATDVLVPDLFAAEVVNAVWKNHHFLGVGLLECESLLAEALGFPNVIVPNAELAPAAFRMAAASKHPAYDMFYLALARRESAMLFTKDKALRRLAQRYDIEVA